MRMSLLLMYNAWFFGLPVLSFLGIAAILARRGMIGRRLLRRELLRCNER